MPGPARQVWLALSPAVRLGLLWAGVLLATAVTAALTLVGVAFGALLFFAAVMDENAPSPHPLLWANVLAVATFLCVGLIVGLSFILWTRLATGRWYAGAASGCAIAALVVAVAWQTLLAPPGPGPDFSAGLASVRPNTRYDIALLVDPGEGAGRRLIDQAQRSPDRVLAPPPTVRWDTDVALTAPTGFGSAGVLAPLTPLQKRGRVVLALRALRPSEHSNPSGLALALQKIVVDGFPWRKSSARAVVLVLDRLPAPSEMTAVAQAQWRDAMRRLSGDVVSSLFDRPSGVRLLVVTPDEAPSAYDVARGTKLPLAGAVVHPPTEPSTQTALQAAEVALTPGPSAEEERLAFEFRPHLRFDSGEKFGPIDVDAMLDERDSEGVPVHKVCSRGVVPPDTCRFANSGSDLTSGSYLDIAGGLRHGADLPRDLSPTARTRPRIYYHLTEGPKGRLQLDYWWFFRFNVSPVRTRSNCLAGLSIADATCFDHEGDWEGVTVTVNTEDPHRPTLESTTFDAHAHGSRVPREQLQLEGATHPVVYVAAGSHASYPDKCDGSTKLLGGCNQPVKKFGHPVPDGRRNGGIAWDYNSDARCLQATCALALPVSSFDRAALWNAFPGRWGRAACTYFTKLCVKSDGPASPSAQARYRDPAHVHR